MVKLDLKMIVLYIVDFFFVRMFHLTQIQDDSLSLYIYTHIHIHTYTHTHQQAYCMFSGRLLTMMGIFHQSKLGSFVPGKILVKLDGAAKPMCGPSFFSKPKSLQNNGFNGAFMSKLALQNLVISGEMGCAAPSGAKTYEISGGLQARGARMPGSQPSKIGDLTNSELA